MRNCFIILLTLLFGQLANGQTATDIEIQVANVERAFAKTMADRDLEAFSSFLADDAVFRIGENTVRGKKAVVEAWRSLYEGDVAPFKWEPETVMANEDGTLALSTGPVSNEEQGIFSYYTSIWRKNTDGSWSIIFDKGQKYCEVCAD